MQERRGSTLQSRNGRITRITRGKWHGQYITICTANQTKAQPSNYQTECENMVRKKGGISVKGGKAGRARKKETRSRTTRTWTRNT